MMEIEHIIIINKYEYSQYLKHLAPVSVRLYPLKWLTYLNWLTLTTHIKPSTLSLSYSMFYNIE